MQTLLSGLSEQASRAYNGALWDNTHAFAWKPAAQLIGALGAVNDTDTRPVVWLYRAPWNWLTDGNQDDIAAALKQWQMEQRAVLQLRRTLRQRLTLVNIDRVLPHSLFERLGIAHNDQSVQLRHDPLASTLAGVFEQVSPEIWTLYESLEAASWTPSGEPEFRSNRLAPTLTGLIELLSVLQLGQQHPIVQLRLHEQESTIKALRCKVERAHSGMFSDQRENEQRHLQLQQARQLSAEHEAENLSLRNQCTALQHQITQLIKEMSEQPQPAGVTNSIPPHVADENVQLMAQLRQVQSELEKREFECLTLSGNCTKLKQDLDQNIAAYQQACKELASTEKNANSLSEENETLLSQLHLVQEELENYYLANREILCAMDQSNNTLHRARKLISRVAAHV